MPSRQDLENELAEVEKDNDGHRAIAVAFYAILLTVKEFDAAAVSQTKDGQLEIAVRVQNIIRELLAKEVEELRVGVEAKGYKILFDQVIRDAEQVDHSHGHMVFHTDSIQMNKPN